MIKRLYQDKRETLVLAATALVVVAYLLKPELFSEIGFAPFGLAALLVGYFSGLIALIVGVFYTIATFIAALPLVSAAYAFIAYSIARAHYSVAQWFTFKVLDRVRWYQEAKLKVKNSRTYRAVKSAYNMVLVRSGIAEPHPLKIFKIKKCMACGEDIPLGSKICPYCGRTQ
jgi:hypothetical protein